MKWPIGVCSWSLQRTGNQLAEALRELGLNHIHLAYREPARPEWKVTSTMIGFPQEDYSTLESIRQTGGIVPDAEWPRNRKLFGEATKITADLSVPYLSMHAGFLEHTPKFYDRIRNLADIAGENGVTVLLETGQETAADLKKFLEKMNHPALGVNFDPANMILYGKGDPIESVKTLAPWVRHVHIKDAVRTKVPGTWGTEVPWGEGEAGGVKFLQALENTGYRGALAIEREAGRQRIADIKLAVQRLTQRKTR